MPDTQRTAINAIDIIFTKIAENINPLLTSGFFLVDSGSPLLLVDQPWENRDMGHPNLDFIIGFNIDGSPCGTPNKPDIYTNLTEIYDWITGHVHIWGI